VAEREYTRLTRGHLRTGFAVAVTSRCSLWLGHDHLLFIDSNGYTENYKRFYFRDIQAFTLGISKRRLVWNLVLGILTAICLMVWLADIFSISPTKSVGGIITGVLLTLLFAVPLLFNNLLGPTCSCQIKTAVQSEELPSLNRLRRARRVLARLRPFIIEAQGGFQNPVAIATQASPAPVASSDIPNTAAPGTTNPAPPPNTVH